jgi:VCBS repeat-containing protein
MRINLSQIIDGAGGLLAAAPGGNRITQFNGIGDVDGDGRDDYSVTSFYLGGGTSYVFRSSAQAWTWVVADVFYNSSLRNLGVAPGNTAFTPIAGLGDINGDGRADFGTGQPGASGLFFNSSEFHPGVGMVVTSGNSLGATLNLSTIYAGSGGYAVQGREIGFWTAFTLGRSGTGDFNGDGLNDLIYGSKRYTNFPTISPIGLRDEAIVQFGSTAVNTGGRPLLAENLAAGNGGFLFSGKTNGTFQSSMSFFSKELETLLFNWPSFVGDLNGDGYSDMAMIPDGRIAILYGRPGDGTPALQAEWLAPSGTIGILDGYTNVRAAGDLNGDGYDDLIAMTNGNDRYNTTAGTMAIFYGGPNGLRFGATVTPPPAGLRDVAAVGDVNGDGFGDLLFQRAVDLSERRTLADNYLLFGGPTLTMDRLDLVAATQGAGGLVIATLQDYIDPAYHAAIAAAGDVNGDGFADLLAPDVVTPGTQFRIIHGTDFSGALAGRTDIKIGTAGNDTLLGGTDAQVMRGAAGDDILAIQNTNFRLIDGGSGTDTLHLNGAGMTLDLVPPGPRRVTEIEAIELGDGDNTLRISALGILNLSDTSNTLTVTGGPTDRVLITDGGWTRGASTGGFTSFTNGQAVLRLQDAIAPANATGAPRFIGTAAAERANGSVGNDMLDGAGGADTLLGLGGDDLISVASTSFGRVDGDAGTDTLLLAGQNIRLDLTKLATGALTNIETLDLGIGKNTLLLTSASVLAATGGGGTLTVQGAPGSGVGFLDLGWQLSNGAPGYASYTKDGATVLVEREIAGNRGVSGSVQDAVAQGGGFSFTGVAAGDLAGAAVALGDLNGDGLAELVVGAPGANGGLGSVYVVWGKAGGFGGAVNLADVAAGNGGYVIQGGTVTTGGMTLGTAPWLGGSLAILDTNGDGRLDLVMGAPDYDSTGAARLAAGRFEQAGFPILSYNEYGPVIFFDPNDPFAEIENGYVAGYRNNTGAIFVRLGEAGQQTAPLSLSTLASGQGGWMIEGRLQDSQVGKDIQAVGDYDRDGWADFVFSVSTPNTVLNGWNGYYYWRWPMADLNSVHIIRGSATAPAPVRDLAAGVADDWARIIYTSEGRIVFPSDRHIGYPMITAVGDINRDGSGDVFFKHSYQYFFPLILTGLPTDLAVYDSHESIPFGYGVDLSSDTAHVGSAYAAREIFSRQTLMAAIGDVDGDGRQDVMFGQPYAYQSGTAFREGAGIVTVAFGGLYRRSRDREYDYSIDKGNVGYDDGDVHIITILGETTNGRAGSFVGAGGDVNGDGLADMLVGNAAGDLFVVFGARSFPGMMVDLANVAQGLGGFVLRGAMTGVNSVTPGDLNADGFGDLIFSNVGGDSGAGVMTVFYGRDFTLGRAAPAPTVAVTQVGTVASEALRGGLAADSLASLAGNDLLTGFDGNDTLLGGEGDDTLEGGLGADSLDGGVGLDTATYASSAGAVTVSLAIIGGQNTGGAGTDTLVSIENLIGSAASDRLTGDDGANRLEGGAGNDTLDGGIGNDTLVGGTGDDSITGGGGTDSAVFDRAVANYTITYNPATGLFTIIGDGTDLVSRDVETLNFADTAINTAGLSNTAPVITSGGTASFAESGTDTAYSATASDPDPGTTLTWSLGGADAGLFDISASGAVTFKTAPNFEAPGDAGTNNVYDITVTASDGALSSAAQAVAITVTNANEAPSVTSGATASFAENGTGTVYTATGSDPDAGATLTYALGGADAGLFDISASGAVTFKTAPNFEAPADAGSNNVYDITVTASDGALSSAAQAVAITVANANEAPSVTSGATASFAENGTGTVYTATGSDPDAGATLTYALGGTDAGLFDISASGAVTFKTAPNFEAPGDTGTNNVYDITVTASDGALSSAAQAVAITVTDVNEAPIVTSGATASFAENGTGTAYQAAGSDPEGTTRIWSLGGADAALFNISSSGAVTFKTAPNFEAPADAGTNNVYDITVTASDGALSSAAQAVAITVTNANEAPSVTSGATASFSENGTGTVYTATGSDPDAGATLTYALGGTDAGLFNINATSGAVTFKAAPNFEAPGDAGGNNVYDITVTASDGALSSAAQAVAITVTDVNEAPIVTSGATASFAENGTGTVYTATGSDPDASATLTYALGGTDAGLFDISASGAVTFKTAPDFEAPRDAGSNNVYDITVTATDGALSSAARAVAITVTDVNEAPPVITSGGSASFAENGTGPAYQAAGTDQDAGTSLSWSLGGTDAALFDIDSVTGVVTFKAAPNFEVPADVGTNNVYDITVTASDGALSSTARAVAIAVTNVAETPVVTSGGTASLAENATGIVYEATGSVVEAGTTRIWSLGGGDRALFDIDAATGAVTFKTAPDFEAPGDAGTNNVYDITVTASDGALSSAAQAVAITVTNVNEAPPVITSGGTASFAENGTGTAYQAIGSDADAGTSLTWSLSGADAALFNISSAGAVTFKAAPNFETPTDGGGNNVYDFVVGASDGLTTITRDVVITVTDVLDPVTRVGGASNDTLTGDDLNDSLVGGDGDDSLIGLAGNDTLSGGNGNDTVVGGPGDDSLSGGPGIDTVDYTRNSADQPVNVRAGAVFSDGLGGRENLDGTFEVYLGGSGNDTISSSDPGLFTSSTLAGFGGDDDLTGGQVADVLLGGEGNDTLNGSIGDDTVMGGNGNDCLLGGTGNDSLLGEAGDDVLLSGIGFDTLDGGQGINTADFSSMGPLVGTLNVTVSGGARGNGTAVQTGTVIFISIQNIIGSQGNDIVDFSGATFASVLTGFSGNDTLLGGEGDDTLEGGLGADSLDGGVGLDTATYASSAGAVTVSLAIIGGQNTGGAGTDTLVSIENLIGSAASDRLTGDDGANRLEGGAGNDTLDGGIGNDTLVGGTGDDSITGGGGTDSAVFDRAVANYTITYNPATGLFTIIGDGTDLVSRDVETLNFADTAINTAGLSNTAPVITSGGTASFAESGTDTAYSATASDPDPGTTLTWSLGGADAGLFDISASGAVTFKTAPNFEAPADAGTNNVYDITVTASDGALSSAAQAVAITVTNANEAPSVTSSATASYAENGTGTAYQAAGSDPDAGTTLTYALGGTDAGLFNISSSGAVTFKTAPNFEAPADAGTNNVYDITVTASDGTLSTSRNVAITVTNANEAPSVTSGATASFAENGTGTVYTATGSDPDAGATLTYALGGADAALFNISSSGAVTFKTAPNFEAPADAGTNNVYDITVTASDGALSSAAQAVAITVTDVTGPAQTGIAGPDTLTVEAENGRLSGLGGNDTLTGGVGRDTLDGGDGNDVFVISDTLDLIIETAGGGADTIITSVSMTMPDHVETLQIAAGISGITITGGAGNDILIGNGLPNNLNGGAGDDVILVGNVTLADIYALFAT